MSALGCFGRFTLFSPRVSHSNTRRLLSFVCSVLLFGFVALVCFCFLFCECLGIPNSPRSLDLDDRQGLIARSAMQQKKTDEPEDPEEEEPDDDNVLDEVGADTPCVTDEPEAETLPSGEPSSSSHPSSSTPRVSGPSLPWIDVNDELEWPGGPPKYDPFDRPRSRSPRTN